MPDAFWDSAGLPLAMGLLSTLALVACDFRGWRPGRYLFKPLSALAFIWLAWSLGATQSSYGTTLLIGLALCMVGDLALMFEREDAFLLGLVAFLSGHLAYVAAFALLPMNATGLWTSLLLATGLVTGSLRWLIPHISGVMRYAVPLYILVIASMLVVAGGTMGLPASALIISGAWAFAISDLAVARRQFISSSRYNQLWGTPLYFLAQYLLASSVAFY
ncbi:lysoplasmalogenase [Halioglobus maricola]|uniref:Lysoplasmalogenase n=1 Tax=Halioglobus maricola TaxID=2601894 RepID=A0A5P9NHK6_9GAMM|nr:lysoplasmalogenase [Halioglobus maricola]QFU75009.1 lysoplasmalogenase [Halioglobus maricola]